MGRANDLICLITLPDSYVLAIEAQKNSCCFQIFDEVSFVSSPGHTCSCVLNMTVTYALGVR